MSTKKAKKHDPHAQREARKYEHPIPSREFILETLAAHDAPMPLETLASGLGLKRSRDLDSLEKRLRAMERDGQVLRNRREGYGLVKRMDLVPGRVIAHRDGYGFLAPDDGSDDLYLSSRQMRALMHGDRVLARVGGIDRRGRREGRVVEVLERNITRVVGRLHREGGVAFVSPDNRRIHHDILIAAEDTAGAKAGDIVVADIVEQPTYRTQPIGKVTEVLGEHMAPGMEINIAIRAHDLPERWPKEAIQEASDIGDAVPESAKVHRTDLRHLPLVTIDGADARDFDDAVYCERKAKGWKLYVAIADVGAYVSPGTALDLEARKRGNSVYFPNRVIPMLPESLSNGLCSLKPEQDRLCMVCELYVSDDGEVTRSRFYEGLMYSHARLTYDTVAAIVIDKDVKTRQAHDRLVGHLDELYGLFKAFLNARQRRGAIDFETTETRFVFSDALKIERVEPARRNDAHRIIEECMVAANVAAARYVIRHRMPALYRIHEEPDPDKVAEVRAYLVELGLKLGGGERPQPRHYAQMVTRSAGRVDADLIQIVLLRSLSQAVYSPQNVGHFGLAHRAYAHFTSPIRRYADLLLHRAIKHVLHRKPPGQFQYTVRDMELAGEQTSMTERRADDATRDAVDWLKCEFMLDKVGQRFDGVISAVTSFGIFVLLEDIYVEGLVHVSELDSDYYHYDPVHHRLEGERSGRTFSLGDHVRVDVARVDVDDRKVDFELVSGGSKIAQSKRRRKAGRTKSRHSHPRIRRR